MDKIYCLEDIYAVLQHSCQHTTMYKKSCSDTKATKVTKYFSDVNFRNKHTHNVFIIDIAN